MPRTGCAVRTSRTRSTCRAGGRRRAAGRRSASRISPGGCGRQTQVSVSSTSSMRRPRAERSITARADSTSGSSGTRSVLRPGQPDLTGRTSPGRRWGRALALGAAARGQVAQAAGPGAAVLGRRRRWPSPAPAGRAGVDLVGVEARRARERYADRAPWTARARSRPAGVSRTARDRPSAPGAARGQPAPRRAGRRGGPHPRASARAPGAPGRASRRRGTAPARQRRRVGRPSRVRPVGRPTGAPSRR